MTNPFIGTCPQCGSPRASRKISCPDGKPGCAVLHQEIYCPTCGDSAANGKLREEIWTIPSNDGWSSERMYEAYLDLAKRLVSFGVSADNAVDVLTEAYAYAMGELAHEIAGV